MPATHEHDHENRDSIERDPGADRMSNLLGKSLRTITLFSTLDDKAIHAIAALCRCRQFQKDQSVLTQGEDSTEVFFVIEGEVRATLYAINGKEVSFEDIGPGGVFGELAAIDDAPRSTSVVALEDTTLAVVSADAFRTMLISHPGLGWVIAERLACLVRRLCDRVFEYTTLDVSERVQAEVLRMASDATVQSNCAEIADFPTHAEFASRISTHREAVTREINALERRNLIRRRRGSFVVCDYQRLSDMVAERRP